MNYTMLTNQAHARTTPPPPLGEPESKKIGFIAPILIFPSKTINMLCRSKLGTTNVVTS